jgi:hypothetical protein
MGTAGRDGREQTGGSAHSGRAGSSAKEGRAAQPSRQQVPQAAEQTSLNEGGHPAGHADHNSTPADQVQPSPPILLPLRCIF